MCKLKIKLTILLQLTRITGACNYNFNKLNETQGFKPIFSYIYIYMGTQLCVQANCLCETKIELESEIACENAG